MNLLSFLLLIAVVWFGSFGILLTIGSTYGLTALLIALPFLMILGAFLGWYLGQLFS